MRNKGKEETEKVRQGTYKVQRSYGEDTEKSRVCTDEVQRNYREGTEKEQRR